MFNRDSDLLFTCAKDNSPQVWYSSNGERLGSYDGHEGAIYSCDVSYDSKRFISGSGDMTARLWNTYSGECLKVFPHKQVVRSVAFATGDDMFLTTTNKSAGTPSEISVYALEDDPSDIDTEPVRTIQHVDRSANFIKALWGALNAYIVTCDDSGYVSKWDFDEETLITRAKVAKGAITDMCFSADKSMILISSKDNTAVLLDAETLEVKKTYTSNRPLNTCAFNPKLNHVLFAGGQDANDVTITKAKDGDFAVDFYHTVYEERLGAVSGHFGPVNTVAVSPDGLMFASGGEDGFIRLHHFDQTYLNSTY